MRAAIGRGDQRAAGSAPDHDVVAEQADGERGVIDVGHLGDDVPETAQRWSVDEHDGESLRLVCWSYHIAMPEPTDGERGLGGAQRLGRGRPDGRG